MLQAIAICSCIGALCLWCGFISICCPRIVDRMTKLSARQFKCPRCPEDVNCTGMPNTRASDIDRMNGEGDKNGDDVASKKSKIIEGDGGADEEDF